MSTSRHCEQSELASEIETVEMLKSPESAEPMYSTPDSGKQTELENQVQEDSGGGIEEEKKAEGETETRTSGHCVNEEQTELESGIETVEMLKSPESAEPVCSTPDSGKQMELENQVQEDSGSGIEEEKKAEGETGRTSGHCVNEEQTELQSGIETGEMPKPPESGQLAERSDVNISKRPVSKRKRKQVDY